MTDRSRRKSASPSNASRPKDGEPPPAAQASPHAEPAAWEPWIQLIRQWFPAAGIVIAVASGAFFGIGTALLVLAATTLLVAISTIWSSLQWIAGESVEYSGRAFAWVRS